MCGITGVYSTNFGAWEFDVFQKLLLLNVFRGDDSTGVIRAEHGGRIATRKSLLPSPAFVMSKTADIIEDDKTGKNFKKPYLLMGHTRAATKGEVSLKNAHPFGFSNVVGMHNGTIHTSFKHRNEYETDSEAFYRNLNDYGLVEALEDISAYDTAYAFQWIDKKEKTLNFVKNDKRPLYFTYGFAGSTLVWSSDRKDIEYVLQHKKFFSNEGWDRDKTDKYFTLGVNDLLTIPIGKHPDDDARVTKLNIKKNYTTYTYVTTGRGGTTTGTTRTSTNQDLQGIGEWVETDKGWRYQYTESSKDGSLTTAPTQHSTNSSRSQNETSTTTEDTSETTQGTKSTSTQSSQANQGSGEQRRGRYDERRNYKDEFGPRLKTLAWLGPKGDEAGGPSDSAGKSGGDDSRDKSLDMSSFIDELFDTDHKAANNPDNIIPFKKGKDRGVPSGGSIRGFKGQLIPEAEFRHHLSQGCFCCGEVLSLDNPHDFAQINNLHWWERDLWACDYCYHTSKGDWVRKSIDDTWAANERKAK